MVKNSSNRQPQATKKFPSDGQSASKKKKGQNSSNLLEKTSLQQRHATRDSENLMNLAVLKRKDTTITSIIDKSSHVVAYQFDVKNNEWTKKGVEGSLIVFERSISPKYGFFILNRRGVENIFELVDYELQFKYERPYLLYRTNQSTIVGIWFYVEKEQHRITSLLTKLSVDTRYNQGKEEEEEEDVVSDSNTEDEEEENNGIDGNNVDLLAQLNQSLQDKQLNQSFSSNSNGTNNAQNTNVTTTTQTPIKHFNMPDLSQYSNTPVNPALYATMPNMMSPFPSPMYFAGTPPPAFNPPLITPSRLNFDSPMNPNTNSNLSSNSNSNVSYQNLIQSMVMNGLQINNSLPKNMSREQFKNYLVNCLLHDQNMVNNLYSQYSNS